MNKIKKDLQQEVESPDMSSTIQDQPENVNGGYFSIIPNPVRFSNVSPNAKLLYGDLVGLSNKHGYAFATNSWLSKRNGVHEITISKQIKELIDAGFIRSESINGYQRKIYPILSMFPSPNPNEENFMRGEENVHIPKRKDLTPLAKTLTPLSENANHSNKYSIKNNKKDIYSSANAEQNVYSSEISEIINYLNLKTNRKFQTTNKKTIQLITRQFNDGYTLDDFIKVIDNKVDQWKFNEDFNNDLDMSKYLRPKTLFGDNFESYVNTLPADSSAQLQTYTSPEDTQLTDKEQAYLDKMIKEQSINKKRTGVA